jgi:hypothetical protein
MQFLSWWRGGLTVGPAVNRLARFRKVLSAARDVPVYEASLRIAQLDTSGAIRRVASVESVLPQLGMFSLDQVRVRPPRSLNEPVRFHSPLPLASHPDVLWDSAGCTVRQLAPDANPTFRALIVRTGLDEGLLTASDRDALWQRHGLPMFEHLTGMDGELLAFECETHSGLHIMEDNVAFQLVGGELLLTSLTDLVQPTLQTRTGWSARIETEPCDCGRAGRRLIGLEHVAAPAEATPALAHAAHA